MVHDMVDNVVALLLSQLLNHTEIFFWFLSFNFHMPRTYRHLYIPPLHSAWKRIWPKIQRLKVYYVPISTVLAMRVQNLPDIA